MKKITLILAFALVTNLSFSQEMKTLFKKDTVKSNTYGGYGAPMVGMGMVNNNPGITIGAKGGMIKNHKFGIGGIGGALIGNKSTAIKDTIFNDSSSTSAGKVVTHNLAMGYGGIFLEYIFNYTSPIHVSIPLNLEVGGVWGGKDLHSDSKIKSSAFFMIEPGINIEFNFATHFVPSINIGYRYVTGSYSSQLSGLNVGLVMKIGKF